MNLIFTENKAYTFIGLDKQNEISVKLLIFSYPYFSSCFGCLIEPYHKDGSFEYPQHMFS